MRGTLAATPVGEIMDREPLTVRPHTMMSELVRLFETECVDAVPVVDARGVLCGIVTSLDVLRAMRPSAGLGIPGMRSLPSRRVGSVMRPGVITLEATDPILAAIDLMVDTRFHMLPVVRRDARGPVLIGVVPQRLVFSRLLALSRASPASRQSRVPGRFGHESAKPSPKTMGRPALA